MRPRHGQASQPPAQPHPRHPVVSHTPPHPHVPAPRAPPAADRLSSAPPRPSLAQLRPRRPCLARLRPRGLGSSLARPARQAAAQSASAPRLLAQHGKWQRSTPALLGRHLAPEPHSCLAARLPDPMPSVQEATRIGRRRGRRRQALRRADPARARTFLIILCHQNQRSYVYIFYNF